MHAIVLKRRNFREYDQIISFYTENSGKINLLARGIKKITSKNSSNLLPGALVDIDLAKGREIDHLTKVQNINIFKCIRNDLTKLFASKYAVELVDKLVGHEENNDQIFNLLQKYLSFMDSVDILNRGVVYSFILNLFVLLGFHPNITMCSHCHSADKRKYWFDIKDGGIVCDDCYDIIIDKNNVYSVSHQQLEYMHILLKGIMEDVNRLEEDKKTFKLIKNYITFHSESNIQTI